MKTLHTYVISVYLFLTTIPVLVFGGLGIAREIYLTHNSETERYEQVLSQQQVESRNALLDFDLTEAELVATRVAQLDYIISVKLESFQYAMTMAEIVNSGSKLGETLSYPIYDDHQLIGQLTVIKDRNAFITDIIYNSAPQALVLLSILSITALLFSRTIVSALKRPFMGLQKFAFQITNGDYQTPSRTDSDFVEIAGIFKALETMRAKLKTTITQLKDSEERYSKTYNLTQVCLFVIDIQQRKLVRSNSMFNQILSQIPTEERRGKLDRFLTQLLDHDHTESFHYSLEFNGLLNHYQVNHSPEIQGEIECSALDITQLIEANRLAERQLVTDVLTQVSNRFCFNRFIDRVGKGQVNDVTIMMIDLNGFKTINDTYGHNAGDKVLVDIAHRLNQALEHTYQNIYRLGGDEFVITIEAPFNMNKVQQLAAKIQTTAYIPVQHQNHQLSVSLSIGIEHYSHNKYASIEKSLNNADILMYQAKSDGLGVKFSPALDNTPTLQAE